MPLPGKIIAIGAVLFAVLLMCSGEVKQVPPAADAANQANSDADGTGPSTDQMFSAWSQFVTGRNETSGFVLIDGSGKPGQFCSASDGQHALRFGGQQLGGEQGIQIYDYLAALDTSNKYAGAFWFDPAQSQLALKNRIKTNHSGGHPRPVPDQTLHVEQVEPGVVSIDGARFHQCVP